MPNSVQKGNALEELVFNRFGKLLRLNKLAVNGSQSKIFQKKGYFSKDRNGDIIVDVVIEAYDSQSNISFLMIFECKNYSHAVPVNDAEEFVAKLDQIAHANRKGIIVSTKGFQNGTIKYAQSKGLGLYRVLPKKHTHIVLGFKTTDDLNSPESFKEENPVEALINPHFESEDGHEGVWFLKDDIGFGDITEFLTKF